MSFDFSDAILVIRVRGKDPRTVNTAGEDIAILFGNKRTSLSSTHLARDDPNFYIRFINVFKEAAQR